MKAFTMDEALRFIQACELGPGVIQTDGKTGQVQFAAPLMSLTDLQTYIEAFAGGVNIAPASIKITQTKTQAGATCFLVIINTEN